MTEPDSGKVIATVERATDVLDLFAERREPTLGVTEISKELGLSKAVVHRILSTLVQKGFAQLDPVSRRYALGPRVLRLGLAYLDRIDIRQLAQPVMHGLVDATDETSTLSIRSGWTRVYVAQVTPLREVRMSVELGRPYPLHAGSSSKAFLAFLDDHEQDEYLAQQPLEPLTERTIADPDALRKDLAETRGRGYAVSLSERQAGAASVAAPVLDHRGLPVAVLSLCGPLERFVPEIDRAAGLLTRAVAQLSDQLGHRGAAV